MSRHILLLILTGIILTACNAGRSASDVLPTETPASEPTLTPSPTEIAFAPLTEGARMLEMSNGKTFPVNTVGQGKTAIIIANGVRAFSGMWTSLIEPIDKEKFTVVTYSYMQVDPVAAVDETRALLVMLREAGYKRIICFGISLGVTSCGSISDEPEMVGIVLVAGPENGQNVHDGDCQCDGLAKRDYPKLFIAGAENPYAEDTQKIYEQAIDPKKLVLFPENGVPTAHLMESKDGDAYLNLLLEFFNSIP